MEPSIQQAYLVRRHFVDLMKHLLIVLWKLAFGERFVLYKV